MVAGWRYEPFVDSNGPVIVDIREVVAIYPPERRNPPTPFPKDDDPLRARITLERTACYGSCPVYSVELNGDGTVRYQGAYFVAAQGVREYRIDPAEFSGLLEEFRRSEFFSLLERYEAPITDHPTYILSLSVGDEHHAVEDYVGTEVGMPVVVTELERRVDEVARTAQWVGREARD